ncbi:Late embryogenesis abundant protein [Macleaya cordata]|uniref:Late embryogenesis abundant protein n=1 Tax=Macleaya cordata TaxID=56857 RepID=A0A200QRE2_MACCD|nr:Late embryogenesis abundant protein [Macleaya cordata]
MANKLLPLKNSFLTLISRRAYSVLATENAKMASSTATVMKKVLSESGNAGTEAAGAESNKEVFWMKDPKTGYWIPESHFDEVDVVELREKFLSKKY